MDYDDFADAYALHTRGSLHNAHYERPALQALVGDVAGKSVLDAGCASGENVAALLARGATVTAVDISSKMIQIVRERFGDAVSAFVADLAQPLTHCKDASFDLVLSSLTMHYIEHWTPVLREFRRVLRPGGRVVFSTHHPEVTRGLVPDYFPKTYVRDTWAIAGQTVSVAYWHRPLETMLAEIAASGLRLARLREPRLAGSPPGFEPAQVRALQTSPWFLIFELVA